MWGHTLDLVGALINAESTRTFVHTSAEALNVYHLESPPLSIRSEWTDLDFLIFPLQFQDPRHPAQQVW